MFQLLAGVVDLQDWLLTCYGLSQLFHACRVIPFNLVCRNYNSTTTRGLIRQQYGQQQMHVTKKDRGCIFLSSEMEMRSLGLVDRFGRVAPKSFAIFAPAGSSTCVMSYIIFLYRNPVATNTYLFYLARNTLSLVQ